jgi:hypothetical protein
MVNNATTLRHTSTEATKLMTNPVPASGATMTAVAKEMDISLARVGSCDHSVQRKKFGKLVERHLDGGAYKVTDSTNSGSSVSAFVQVGL